MGKRKIAYAADPSAPMFGGTDLRVWLGSMQELSWRWRPPTTPIVRAEQRDALFGLPHWLAGWILGPRTTPDIVSAPSSDEANTDLPSDVEFTQQIVLDFRRALSAHCGRQGRQDLCIQFNYLIKQSLIIGAVDEELLKETLLLVSESLQYTISDKNEVAMRKLDFVQAVWEGISSCKVIPLKTLKATTMDLFLSLVADVPFSTKAAILVRQLLSALCVSQLKSMPLGFLTLVKSWSHPRTESMSLRDRAALVLKTEQSVESLICSLENHLLRSLHAVKQPQEILKATHIQGARRSVFKARHQLWDAILQIKQCEDALLPIRASTLDVILCLKDVPADNLCVILEASSAHLDQVYELNPDGMWDDGVNFRTTWLSIAAQLPNIGHKLFVRTWKSVENHGFHIPDALGSELIFSRLSCQGLIRTDPRELKNSFEANPLTISSQDYGSLLAALLTHERRKTAAEYLFKTLHETNRQDRITNALCFTRQHRKRIPLRLLRPTLANLARFKSRAALKAYRRYAAVKYSPAEFNHAKCPEFALSLIDNDRVAPEDIWKLLGIPIYEKLTDWQRPERCEGLLSHRHIRLIHMMANRFATTRARPQRVAMRGVTQCMYHLHRHHIPLSRSMSKAITHAGITREVLRNNWIGKERASWIFSIIEECEGPDVAVEVQALVKHWTEQLEVIRDNERTRHQQQAEGLRLAESTW